MTRRIWRLRLVALVAILWTLTVARASAHNLPDEVWATIQTQAAAFGVNPWQMERILHCESAHYDPRVMNASRPGSSGELGIAQILPTWTAAARRYGTIGGEFEARGGEYDQPADGIRFLARMLSRGGRSYWHCP